MLTAGRPSRIRVVIRLGLAPDDELPHVPFAFTLMACSCVPLSTKQDACLSIETFNKTIRLSVCLQQWCHGAIRVRVRSEGGTLVQELPKWTQTALRVFAFGIPP